MKRTPRALAACERSGKLRRALLRRGFDAWSCDLEPADDETNRHIIGDVREVMQMGWDLIIVCHPPCTRLCRAGQRWLYGPDKTHPKVLPKGRTHASMIAEFHVACDLFMDCMNAPCPHVAVENPEMHKWAKERMPDIPAPQFVQPYWFGDAAFKKTGLHLRGLPELKPTNLLTPPARGTDEYKQWAVIHRAPPGPDRSKFRSETFDGFAEAAALQWGDYVMERLAA